MVSKTISAALRAVGSSTISCRPACLVECTVSWVALRFRRYPLQPEKAKKNNQVKSLGSLRSFCIPLLPDKRREMLFRWKNSGLLRNTPLIVMMFHSHECDDNIISSTGAPTLFQMLNVSLPCHWHLQVMQRCSSLPPLLTC